jgi:hypothetical protein
MALPTTGPMTAALISAELGRASTAVMSLDDAAVRSMAGKASGTITMADLRGKVAETVVAFTLTCGYFAGSGSGSSIYFAPQRGYARNPPNTVTGAIGSISPATFRGYTFYNLRTTGPVTDGGSDYNISISLTGPPAKTIFKRMEIWNGSTLQYTYYSSSSTYSSTTAADDGSYAAYATWSWALSGHILPTSGTRTIRLYY